MTPIQCFMLVGSVASIPRYLLSRPSSHLVPRNTCSVVPHLWDTYLPASTRTRTPLTKGLPIHITISHGTGEYVRGQAHVNGVESFWSHMKRGYHGGYHRMSVRHLHRYVGEFCGRHNIREKGTVDQIRHLFASMIGKRLMYSELVAKEGPV